MSRTPFVFLLPLLASTLAFGGLHELVDADNIDEVIAYLKGNPSAMAELNERKNGLTPLAIARANGNTEMIKLLISSGAAEVNLGAHSFVTRSQHLNPDSRSRGSSMHLRKNLSVTAAKPRLEDDADSEDEGHRHPSLMQESQFQMDD